LDAQWHHLARRRDVRRRRLVPNRWRLGVNRRRRRCEHALSNLVIGGGSNLADDGFLLIGGGSGAASGVGSSLASDVPGSAVGDGSLGSRAEQTARGRQTAVRTGAGRIVRR
jgi:hypothetical protein